MNRNELIGRIWQEMNDAKTAERRSEIMWEMFARIGDMDVWSLAIELKIITPPVTTVPNVRGGTL